MRVPAAAEVEEQREQTRGDSEGETYRIARPFGWQDSPEEEPNFAPNPVESQPTPKANREKKLTVETPKKSPLSGVTCPACGASFEMPPSDQAQVVLCPECLEDVHLPAGGSSANPQKETSATSDADQIPWDSFLEEPIEFAEAPPPAPLKKRRKKPKTEVAREPAEHPTRREKSAKNVFETMGEVRQVGEDPPPEWTFFSGVTDFLIRPEVLVRWIYASLGMCFLGWLCALCFYLYDVFPYAMVFFTLPLIWISIMTLSYTAACGMPILAETASGNDNIEGWPEPVMKEQAVDLVYLSFLMIAVEVLSFFLGQILSVLIGPAWLVSLVLLFLLYPIVLLSSLEANSPFVPLTLPILNSLKTVTWAWGVFYGLSGGLMLVWLVPLVWGAKQSGGTQFFAMIFLAPLIAGWCFLYARLLGRLAWRASLEFSEEVEEKTDDKPKKKRKKAKKKKPDSSESSGELQAAR